MFKMEVKDKNTQVKNIQMIDNDVIFFSEV
jgi:hypothetical protein